MTNLELTQLRSLYIESPFFQLFPQAPNGSFEELALAALEYADEQEDDAERVNELYTDTLEQARELKDLLKRQTEFLRAKSNKNDRLTRAASIEKELLDYKEI